MLHYAEAARQGTERLAAAGIAEAALDARILLEAACGCGRQELYLNPDRELSDKEEEQYSVYIARRERREPLQYILSAQSFYGLEFYVDDSVLIPRADTEILVERVLKDGADDSCMLDICTGSGCILISLLKNSSGSSGVGIDISTAALDIARKNADAHRVSAKLYHGDLYKALNNIEIHGFDVIVSNPPYICSEEIDSLQPEVAAYEPRLALDGGMDGLAFYRRIIEPAPRWLVNGGRIYLEIGNAQAKPVENMLAVAGFSGVECIKDYAGLDRVVCGRYKR